MRPDDKRKITSRLNSLHSTGPKTPEGKQRLRRAYARNLILPGEKLADSQKLLDTHVLLWAPTNLIEENLVCEMATTLWRIRRQAPAETSLISAVTPSRRVRPEVVKKPATRIAFLTTSSRC